MRITLEVTKRRLLGVALVAAAVLAAVWGGTALASSPSTNLTVCVRQNAKMFAPANGQCHGQATQYVLVTQTELDALTARVSTLETNVSDLQTLLAGVSRTTFYGKDTLQFSGMNVQVVNGTGSTQTTNGLGNLIVGYDEVLPGDPDPTTSGSHDIVVGLGNNFSSYGGFLGGFYNTISGNYASVTGGAVNTASANASAVSGGDWNIASGDASSVSGGLHNHASGDEGSSISGGEDNIASGWWSAVNGGDYNTASGQGASVLGGNSVTVSAIDGTSP